MGDRLSTISGTAQVVGVLYTTERVPVYNLSIPGSPTYYVGEHGVWVHNASPFDCFTNTRFPVGRKLQKAFQKHGPDFGVEFAGLVGLEPAVLFPPSVVGLLGDPELTRSLGDAHPLAQMDLRFSEFVDDLLCRMPFPGHDCLPSKYAHSTRSIA